MKVKTAVLWWLVNGKEHQAVTNHDKGINTLGGLVSAMFPGINYFSLSGFSQVMNELVIPVLKVRFPELLGTEAGQVSEGLEKQIEVVFPSMGYEWQDSPNWKFKFAQYLGANVRTEALVQN